MKLRLRMVAGGELVLAGFFWWFLQQALDANGCAGFGLSAGVSARRSNNAWLCLTDSTVPVAAFSLVALVGVVMLASVALNASKYVPHATGWRWLWWTTLFLGPVAACSAATQSTTSTLDASSYILAYTVPALMVGLGLGALVFSGRVPDA